MADLYLLPSFLAPESNEHIPPVVINAINSTSIFIVERARTARRFIRSIIKDYNLDKAQFIELDKHDPALSKTLIKEALTQNVTIGLMSEAGTPCIADPGAMVVNMARESGYAIKPLTGPSSIILGLMASGMNGQHFTFHGYLPIKDGPLSAKLRDINREANKDVTQIFIETPYRNEKLLKSIVKNIDPNLYISISMNLNGTDERSVTSQIKKAEATSLGKNPAIYCIGKLQS